MLNEKALRQAEIALILVGTSASASTKAQAAIEAFIAALAKVGLGIRPREPTPDQENAGRVAFVANKSRRENCVLVWKAMWDEDPEISNDPG